MTKYLIFSLITAATLLSACGKDYFWEEKKDLPTHRWTYADSLNFKFKIEDTAAVFNLLLELEYADTFPFQNIYLQLKMSYPNGKQIRRTASFDLFDNEGNSLGDCSDGRCRTRITLQPDAYFGVAGEYGLSAEQFTRRESLPVGAVRFLIEKTSQRR